LKHAGTGTSRGHDSDQFRAVEERDSVLPAGRGIAVTMMLVDECLRLGKLDRVEFEAIVQGPAKSIAVQENVVNNEAGHLTHPSHTFTPAEVTNGINPSLKIPFTTCIENDLSCFDIEFPYFETCNLTAKQTELHKYLSGLV